MRRYYVTDIETGTDQDGDYRRSVLYTHAWPEGTAFDEQLDGTHDWALVCITNPIGFLPPSQAGVNALPDFPMDVKMTAMSVATKNAMTSMLSGRGIPTTVVSNADGFRDVIRGIGQIVQPGFSEDVFGVPA